MKKKLKLNKITIADLSAKKIVGGAPDRTFDLQVCGYTALQEECNNETYNEACNTYERKMCDVTNATDLC